MNGCVFILKVIKQVMAIMATSVAHRRSRHFMCNPYVDDEVVEGNAKNCVGACTPSTS